ncbi:Flp family type IVb pilin [Qipengyuania sp. Mu-71]|jgi:pilus assembly protein Flp/PilA|uniref:Flp family type IVb pilin n=1 Tax=Qipengyuania sp. Mu-71 TaxID=3121477 RepID=UPI002FE4D9E4
MVEFLRKLGRDTRGATAVEYGLILALIFLAMIGGIQAFGTTATAMWTSIEAAVVAVTSG